MPTATTTARRRLLVVAALAVGASVLPASTPASASAPPLPPAPRTAPVAGTRLPALLDRRIASLVPRRVAAARALGRYRTGMVTDPVTGAVLWSSGAGTPMRGASTTKLATAVTTLHVLGTGTRFPTRVVAGTSARDLVLVAGGDPLLTSSQLRSLARDTARALLPAVPAAPATPPPAGTPPRVVRYTVEVDDTLFPRPSAALGWTSSYQPWVVTPVRPLVRDLRNGWDTSADVAAYFAGQVGTALRGLLADRPDLRPHVVYTGRARAAAGAAEVARFAGNSSGAALRWMLLVSDNDVAEMLFRQNALHSGAGAGWAAASATELATLRSLGVDVRGWRLYDGSGVSRDDRVSARGLVQLLTVADSPYHPELNPLRGWLPVAGVSGTLSASAHRFTTRPTSCARGLVSAKTGTLFDTIGLAGYAHGSDGGVRPFAVLVHSVDPRYSKLTVRHAVEVVPATATGCY
ncbi:MAG: hypothetical protein GC157_16740 [Frankiales bacterium]|nr:hypothetical protein [Frankiales bacterium]